MQRQSKLEILTLDDNSNICSGETNGEFHPGMRNGRPMAELGASSSSAGSWIRNSQQTNIINLMTRISRENYVDAFFLQSHFIPPAWMDGSPPAALLLCRQQ